MKIFNLYILTSSFISILFQLLCYKELSGKRINLNFNKIMSIFFIFWLIILNNFYNIEVLTAPFALILVVIVNLIVFNDNFFITLNTTIISYVLVVAIEILLSIFIILIGIFDMNSFMKYSYLTLIFTFITTFFSYLMCKYFAIFRIISKKINNYINNNSYKIFMIVVFAIILLVIDFKYVDGFNVTTYVINVCLLILMLILFIAYLYGIITIDKELKKIDILLDNISKYENVIDQNRINSHEMLNNLILLKSIKNKNSVKYNKLLDDMILSYDSSNTYIKNISLLPKGIKGIVYFKLDKAINSDINIIINISKRISNIFDDIKSNDYIIVCRIIPILLDNAIESAKLSEGKSLIFDLYRLNNDIVISIENSYSGKVDLNKIKRKNFSTKGNNRGLGLFIINNLLSKSKNIRFEQFYKNEYFISKITIKK